MRRQKRKRLYNRKTGQKILLGCALAVLLCSRLFSSIATIQEVEASFITTATTSQIPAPNVRSYTESVQDHIAFQQAIVGQKDIRLQEIAERSNRIERVRSFYNRWNSPMAANAEFIVDTAEKYGIDWRLIPAISIVESSGGRYCFRPYNAFGWGKMGFSSFEHSIDTVSYGLATSYGTSNPYAIAPKYNPVTPSSWASKVSGLMSQI